MFLDLPAPVSTWRTCRWCRRRGRQRFELTEHGLWQCRDAKACDQRRTGKRDRKATRS